MPSKKKRNNGRTRPPLGPHNDFLRADIAAGRGSGLCDDGGDDDDGCDIAAELLASLDARDEADAMVQPQSSPSRSPFSPASHCSSSRSHKSVSLSSSASATGPSLMDKILHPHASRSPPAADGSPPISTASSKDDQDQGSPRPAQGQGIISNLFRSHGDKKTAEDATALCDGAGMEAGLASSNGDGARKVGRQKARKQRKEAAAAAERVRIEEELKANGGNVDEAALERQGMRSACESLGVAMHEITPDGHCLYAAIADQLNLLGKGAAAPVTAEGPGVAKETYKTTRRTTARWMREHEEDFRPFISDNDELMAGVGSGGGTGGVGKKKPAGEDLYLSYCDAVERTAVWGGQPEILAMSRAYRTPIWVVQANTPIVKVGQEEFPDAGSPLMISYHRKMYGLGEHYNSLRRR